MNDVYGENIDLNKELVSQLNLKNINSRKKD